VRYSRLFNARFQESDLFPRSQIIVAPEGDNVPKAKESGIMELDDNSEQSRRQIAA
jgi:hypothetical protein